MPRTQPDQYVFGFGPGGEVISVAEVKRNGRLDHERIEKDETWRLEAGLVVKTELDDGQMEWTVYADPDGDGRWVELAEGQGPLDLSLFAGAATGPDGGAPVKQVLDDDPHVFRFDAAGRVVAVYEVERDGRLDREDIDRDETYALVNGFVVKTEVDDGRLEQTVYADADGDGIWHSIILPQPTSLWDGAVA
ncbi:hypothetical protein [Phenylobacterium kunshanense]|uniref:Uncharacterized protein n=1 Tax=Phenylobacterium kunshanense TaxID=1445034 RepID=A0A328BLM6_9CAUL|nr:hypothetical protein [Phenylobacterium kunshanense]RAK67585.1 hypothetical protein DJ019_06655 [Phenylobacterium kunshanense]